MSFIMSLRYMASRDGANSWFKKNQRKMKKIIILLVLLLTAGVTVATAQKRNKSSKGNHVAKAQSATPKSNAGSATQTFTVNGVSFKMVAVQGGTFTMGATGEQGSDAYSEEKPAHKVTVSSFYIGQTEVTQELWEAVMGGNPSEFAPKRSDASRCSYDGFVADAKRLNDKRPGTVKIPTRSEWDAAMVTSSGSMKRPVENVSWDDCQAFLRKLNQLTGKNFRLPTEAEWEYVARGGNKSRGYKYSGSNNLGNVAWYCENIPSQKEGASGYGTQPVATKSPNELGIYDMSGNVWEWCQDKWYNYDGSSYTGSDRICRGGSWGDNAWICRVSNRHYRSPDDRFDFLGLRLAL